MRIRPVDDKAATAAVQLAFTARRAMTGRVSNSQRAMAHFPPAYQFFMPLVSVLQTPGMGGALPTRLKELAIIKTSMINGCEY